MMVVDRGYVTFIEITRRWGSFQLEAFEITLIDGLRAKGLVICP